MGNFLEQPQNGDVWDKGIMGDVEGMGTQGKGKQEGLVGASY